MNAGWVALGAVGAAVWLSLLLTDPRTGASWLATAIVAVIDRVRRPS